MSNNPLDQLSGKRERKRPGSWDNLTPEKEEAHQKASESDIGDKPVKLSKVEDKSKLKLKYRRRDYGGTIKKTSVEMPEEVQLLWKKYCANNNVSMSDHFFNWIMTELKKAGYIE